MSIRAIQAAMRAEGISPAQKVVLIGLADRAGDDLVCWPKIATLADDVAMSARSVQRHVRSLEAAGLVAVEDGRNPATGRQSANFYRLNLRGDETVTPRPLRGDSSGNRGVTDTALRGDNCCHPLKRNPKKNPKKNPNTQEAGVCGGEVGKAGGDAAAGASDGERSAGGGGVLGVEGACVVNGGLVIPSREFVAFRRRWQEFAGGVYRWTSDLIAARAWNKALQDGARAAAIIDGVEWSVAIATAKAATYVPAVERWLAEARWTQQVPPGDRLDDGDGQAGEVAL